MKWEKIAIPFEVGQVSTVREKEREQEIIQKFDRNPF